MATQTETIGAATSGSVHGINYITWEGNILGDAINAELLPPEANPFFITSKYIAQLALYEDVPPFDIDMAISTRTTYPSDSIRQDMSEAWENSATAIKITAGSLSITLPGPNYSDNLAHDISDAYRWRLSATKREELRTFITAYKALSSAAKDATVITLDDGVVPHTLFAIDGDNNKLFAVADPAMPGDAEEIGSLPLTLTNGSAAAFYGETLYCAEGRHESNTQDRAKFWRIDKTDPSSSQRLGTLPEGLVFPGGMARRDNVLYCVSNDSDGASSLWAINRTLPWSSTKVGDLPAECTNVNGLMNYKREDGTVNDLVCLAGSTSPVALWLIDVENPGSSTRIEALPSAYSGGAGGLTVHGDNAYGTDENTIWRINRWDPSASESEGDFPSSVGSASGFASSAPGNPPNPQISPGGLASPENLHEEPGSIRETSVTLDWDTVDGARGYTVQWKLSADSLYDSENQAFVTPSSYSLTGLEPGTSYDWRVRAEGSNVVSQWVEDNDGFITEFREELIPGAPQNLTAEIKALSIKVSWDPGSNAISYDYQTRGAGDSDWTPVANTTNRTFTFTTTANRTYEWRVRSKRETQTSEWVTGTGKTSLDLEFDGTETEVPTANFTLSIDTAFLAFNETLPSTPVARPFALTVEGVVEASFSASTGTPTSDVHLFYLPPDPEIICLAIGRYSVPGGEHELNPPRQIHLWKLDLTDPVNSPHIGNDPPVAGLSTTTKQLAYNGEGFYVASYFTELLTVIGEVIDLRLGATGTERWGFLHHACHGLSYFNEQLYSIEGRNLSTITLITEGGVVRSSSVGSLPDTFGEGAALAEHGQNLYAFDESSVWQVDLDDLSNSTNIGSFGSTVGTIVSATFHQGILYLANATTVFSASITPSGGSHTLTATSIGTLPAGIEQIYAIETYGRFVGSVLGFRPETGAPTANFTLDEVPPPVEEMMFRETTRVPAAEFRMLVLIANLKFIAETSLPMIAMKLVVIDPAEFSYRPATGLPSAALALETLEPRNELTYYNEDIGRTLVLYEAEGASDPEFIPFQWMPLGTNKLIYIEHILLDVLTGRVGLRLTDGLQLDDSVLPEIFLDFVDHNRGTSYGITGPMLSENFMEGEYVWLPEDDEPFRKWLLGITPETKVTVRVYWNEEDTREVEVAASTAVPTTDMNLGAFKGEPGFENMVVSSGTDAGRVYNASSPLEIDVTYNRPLSVVGTPHITLKLPHPVAADNSMLSNDFAKLDFKEFVDNEHQTMRFTSGDLLELDPDDYEGALSNGAINEGNQDHVGERYSGNDFDQKIAVPYNLDPGVIVGRSPKIRQVVSPIPSNGGETFQGGEDVELRVVFDQRVTVIGHPGLRYVFRTEHGETFDLNFTYNRTEDNNGVMVFTHRLSQGATLPRPSMLQVRQKEFILDSRRNVQVVSAIFEEVESDYELPSRVQDQEDQI